MSGPARQSVMVSAVDGRSPEQIALAARQIADLIDRPIASCTVEAAAESANARVLTIQVRDRRNFPLSGVWMVLVYPALSATGAPIGTATFGTISSGTKLLDTMTAGSAGLFLTDATGKIVVPLAYSSTGTVQVATVVLGQIGTTGVAFA